jgi:hypothetical protein
VAVRTTCAGNAQARALLGRPWVEASLPLVEPGKQAYTVSG